MRTLILSLILFFLATPTMAADTKKLIPCNGPDCSACHVVQLGNNLIVLLVQLLSLAAIIMIVIAGFRLVMSGGNSEAWESAKKNFTNIIIGIILVMSAWLIVDTIMKALVVGNDGGDLSSGRSYGQEGPFNNFGPWNQLQCPVIDTSASAGGTSESPSYASTQSSDNPFVNPYSIPDPSSPVVTHSADSQPEQLPEMVARFLSKFDQVEMTPSDPEESEFYISNTQESVVTINGVTTVNDQILSANVYLPPAGHRLIDDGLGFHLELVTNASDSEIQSLMNELDKRCSELGSGYSLTSEPGRVSGVWVDCQRSNSTYGFESQNQDGTFDLQTYSSYSSCLKAEQEFDLLIGGSNTAIITNDCRGEEPERVFDSNQDSVTDLGTGAGGVSLSGAVYEVNCNSAIGCTILCPNGDLDVGSKMRINQTTGEQEWFRQCQVQ